MTENHELELSARDGKVRITLDGNEIQDLVSELKYTRNDLSDPRWASISMDLIVIP